jgi:hypothetical protein
MGTAIALKAGVFVVGVVLLVIGIALHSHYGPINALCNSPLGQSAQGFTQVGGSIPNLPNCGAATAGSDAGWFLIIGGGFATLGGSIQLIQEYKKWVQ